METLFPFACERFSPAAFCDCAEKKNVCGIPASFGIMLLVWVYFLSYASGDGGPGESIGCMLGNDSTCLQHQCCVKQVITFKDPDKETIVRTKCLAFLKEGEMCLRTPEGYLCDCHPSLRCALSSHATFGYCRRAPSN